ncbi:MAG TPA: tripartite tricarboxylate transporter substrate-binding protein [Alphaproteobacteria bacterium]|nr:tripartite tricarboxylate transporter substrate-binding protein [Alphaproteobacteria bacterium]
MRPIIAGVCAGVLAGLVAQPSLADPIADFYKAKGLTVYIGSEPGGGYDTYGRLVSRHLPRHLPGTPTVTVKNMPGASGIRLSNYIYGKAAKDGSEIGIVQNTIVLEPMMGNKAVQYDPTKFVWLGSVSSLTSTCVVWKTSPVQTMEEARKKELIVGGQDSRSSTVLVPNSLNALTGTKFKVVKGYPSTTSVFLAMERGEVGGLCGVGSDSILGSHNEQLQRGDFKVLVQINPKPTPDLPGVPWVMDYANNAQDRQTLEFLVGRQYFGRPFVAPPGTAADKVPVLRHAFDTMMADKAYLADAAKLRIPVNPVSGADAQAYIAKLFHTPKDVIARADRAADGVPALITEAKLNWIDVKATTIEDVKKSRVTFKDNGKTVRASASGKTHVTIGGQKADRKALKAGLVCDIRYLGDGDAADSIACK